MYDQSVLVAETFKYGGAQVLGPEYEARRRAHARFGNALSRGQWQRLWARLTGQPTTLERLEPAKVRHQQRRYAGLRQVAISRIVGSEDRVRDFDRWFNPRSPHMGERWVNMAVAYELGVVLPPVDLVEVDGRYFVRDGHHRIALARANGQCTVEAEVTVWGDGQPA